MTTRTYPAAKLPLPSHVIALRGDTLRTPLFRHWQPGQLLRRDLTGCTITWKGKLGDGSAVDLSAYLVIDYANGEYRGIVPPSVSNGATPWPAGMGSHDITITDPLGVVITYWAGQLALREGEHA